MQQKKQNEVTTAKKYAEYRKAKEQSRKKKHMHKPHAPKWLKSPFTWAAVTAFIVIAAFVTVYLINKSAVVQPASQIPGYYSMEQTVMGEGVDDSMLTDVSVASEGSDTVIRMTFEGGIPAYTISALDEPARIKVTLNHLSGWEHSSILNWQDQALVLGMFRDQASDDGITDLYFQTTRQIGYKLSEEGVDLVLRLRALDETVQAGYYVTLGAYEAYCADMFDASDMTPVLCADGASVTLISRRYDTSVEAESFAQTLSERIASVLPGVTGSVVQLSGNEAPPLSDAAERAALSQTEVYRPYEGSATPWLWTSNGRLIQWMPDMKRALFTRQTAAIGEDDDYCELWLYDQAGKGQRLLDLEFRTIEDARFSQAGDALAFMEVTDSENLLYYYSLSSGDFVSLSDYVGGNTYGFDFAGDGSLYLVGGVDTPQLTRWDPTMTFGDAARLLEDTDGLTGSFALGNAAYAPNTIFQSDGLNSTYAFTLDTGERQYLTVGGEFEVSPDGKNMLLMEFDDALNVDTYTNMRLRDIQTGRETSIFSGEPIGDVCWSTTGARLYYLTYNYDAATADAFPSILHYYDVAAGMTKSLGLINSSEIHMGADDCEIAFVTLYQSSTGRYLSATYRVTLNQ